MRFLLGILLVVVLARPGAAAEEYTLQPSENNVTYRVAANSFTALVSHPFHVVRIMGRNLRGTLAFLPGAPDKGAQYAFDIEVADLDEPKGPVGSAVAHQIGAPEIKISGNTITVLKRGKTPEDPYTAVVRPRIEIGERFSYPEILLRASLDGKVVRWEFQSEFTLSEFGLPIPKKWFIPSQDRVSLEGEVSFSPKE